MGVGLNDNNAVLNLVDVVVEVGVELGNNTMEANVSIRIDF